MGAQTLTSHGTLLPLIIIIIMTNMHTTMAASSSTPEPHNSYLLRACNSTTYPQICYKSLFSYASTINSNPQKLCSYALSVALKAARNASSTVTKLSKRNGLTHSEALVVKDCIENIRDSIDELKQSVSAMNNLGGANMEYQLGDIKTWVNAALTDDDTCMEGFDEVKVSLYVKNAISKSIVNIARLASNALSLTNSLNY
ncbi:pectinesterase inhibitor 4-like [Rosa sericea]